MHKDSKLEIMINVGKSRLVKVIFKNIHKISDACTNSFGRYIMIAQYMTNVLLFIKFKLLWKNGFSEKIKAHLSQHPQHYNNGSASTFNFFQKIVSPTPI